MVEEIKTPLIDKIYELLYRSEGRLYPLGYHNPRFQVQRVAISLEGDMNGYIYR